MHLGPGRQDALERWLPYTVIIADKLYCTEVYTCTHTVIERHTHYKTRTLALEIAVLLTSPPTSQPPLHPSTSQLTTPGCRNFFFAGAKSSLSPSSLTGSHWATFGAGAGSLTVEAARSLEVLLASSWDMSLVEMG